jgi:pyruvate/2-oxoglutarate dehydrogenase complex dihydrolipoamide acyltransferase (E2) component
VSASHLPPLAEVVPLRGVRGMIADKMVKSLQEAAQLTHHAHCRASALLAERTAWADRGERASIEDLLIHRVVQTLARHPGMNARVEGREVHLFRAIHVSVAIALPGNLLVAPALFDAGSKTVPELRAARQDLVSRAKVNKLSVTEMTGGTFTVSNLGLTRVETFTPILNAPQVGILGIGCMVDRPLRRADGSIDIEPWIGLSLTFDHRAVDGAPAADFLSDLCRAIEGMEA